MERQREEYAIVLEFLPNGYPFDTRPAHRKTAIAQALGATRFSLLELVPKKGIFLQPNQKVYIGEGRRDDVHHITGKIPLDKLTSTAQHQLKYVIEELVTEQEQKFIEFYNKAQPLTMRMHQLELLPGLGKKHMQAILDERENAPFASFEDLRKRVKLMPNPRDAIVHRILNEIEGKEKHKIFTD